jgi:hypothetical protein
MPLPFAIIDIELAFFDIAAPPHIDAIDAIISH